MGGRIVFITGTDTGVGKTVLTALLLSYLRQVNRHALALKLFCSGDRADVELLHALQCGELAPDEINPFYFSKPLAPFAAALMRRDWIPVAQVLHHIQAIRRRCEWLLIEGIGGLCVPLGKDYLVLDLIRRLRCETIVVSSNRLGTLHATLSACSLLKLNRVKKINVALIEQKNPDLSARSNPRVLSSWLRSLPVISIPYLGHQAAEINQIRRSSKKLKKTLAKLLRE